jgi:hypothetical protein
MDGISPSFCGAGGEGQLTVITYERQFTNQNAKKLTKTITQYHLQVRGNLTVACLIVLPAWRSIKWMYVCYPDMAEISLGVSNAQLPKHSDMAGILWVS